MHTVARFADVETATFETLEVIASAPPSHYTL